MVRVPQRGDKRALQETVTRNAKEEFTRHRLKRASDHNSRARALNELQDHLGLPEAPLRIECYDMSHIQGTDYVGSMVVMEDGLPKKSDYRRFKVKGVAGNDDFAAMEEVLTRRLTAYLAERDRPATGRPGRFSYPPQLLLVDGGKGQLGVAERVVHELGLEHEIPVAALAKRFEEVYVPGQSEPVEIPRQSEALYLLQRLRDEAHRFAIGFHRELRGKRMTKSVLDDIPGLGPTRRKRLVKELGGVEGVKRAEIETLRALSWLPRLGRRCRLRQDPRAGRPLVTGNADDGDELWEVHARWWQDGFTDGADPEYTEQILPLAADPPRWCATRARRRMRRGPSRTARGRCRRVARRRSRPDRRAGRRRGRARRGTGVRARRARPRCRSRMRASTRWSRASCSSTSTQSTTRSSEVGRVLVEGGRFLFFLNHPLLQTPNSGWIDDQVLDPPEQYWRIGDYLVEDRTIEEVEKDVFIPFIHRPLSRYVNAMAAAGLVIRHMDEPAPPPGFLARAEEYAAAATIPRPLVPARREGAVNERARRYHRSVSEFLVVTGLSGAGRSQAAVTLEDLGWFVVDNLPATLIPTIADLAGAPGSSIGRVALVVGRGPNPGDVLPALGAPARRAATGSASSSSTRRPTCWCAATAARAGVTRSRTTPARSPRRSSVSGCCSNR